MFSNVSFERNGIFENAYTVVIYYSYFHSTLQYSYGIEFRGFESNVEKISIIQTNIVRIITFSSWNAPCKPIYSEHKIITVPSLVTLKSLLMVQANHGTKHCTVKPLNMI